MRRRSCRAVSTLILLLEATGCATIGETVVRTEDRTLKSAERQEPKRTFFVTASPVTGSLVTIDAVDACQRRKAFEKDAVKYVDSVNESVAADVTWGVLGGVLAGGGTWAVIDAAHVGTNEPDVRVFNAIGKTPALAMGIGAIVAGAGLLTIPLVDGIRASRSREEHRPYTEAGPVLTPSEVCGSTGAPQAAIEVGAHGALPDLDVSFEGEPQAWQWRGVVKHPSRAFKVDLLELVAEDVMRRNPRPKAVSLGMGERLLGSYETAPYFAALDERAWQHLVPSRQRCTTPDSLDDCDDLVRYAKTYPASRFAGAALALVGGAEPAFMAIRDDEAYARADAAGCRTPKTEEACDALKTYLSDWPSGRHVIEGRAALATGQPPIAKMIAAREAEERAAEAKRRAEEAAEAARQRAEEAREAARREACIRECMNSIVQCDHNPWAQCHPSRSDCELYGLMACAP
ncbi:MAG: hypothetical protein FJ096_04045 [Deltaproteobacteria bacterium]|nr:hypothetical protein [Deltaproteobacteria bacterium]